MKKNSLGRTTLAANISIIEESENTFIVIDSEGTGWEERLKDCEGDKDKQHVFDTQFTAFILSAVDVLLINIKADQIGQAEAGWSALVRDIMEINKMFLPSANNRKKTILYIIRDFNEDEQNKDTLKNKIKNSIEEFEEK